MAKCFSNGLEYPFYVVSAYIWEKNPEMENGGDYCLCILLETESKEEAINFFKKTRITRARPEVKLELDTGDDCEWLNTKDQLGYHSDYGIA